jgi:hypothetical protein
MMREKLLALRETRATLVAQAQTERTGVLRIVTRLERATAWFDRAKAIALKLRAHPLWIAGGVALIVAARPRKAVKLFAFGFSLWQGWRNLRATLDRLAPTQPRRAN